MIKVIVTVSVMLGGLLLAPGVYANTNGHMELDTALPQLLEKYNVQDKEELDCDQLTDADFEIIGDSWMEEIHPGEDHEVMDNMMGGEGSETLEAAHVRMGQNYLGCGNYQGMMGNGMMQGRGMMSGRAGMMNGAAGMMGGRFSDYQDNGRSIYKSVNTFLFPLTLISMFAFFTSGTYFFIRKANKKK